MIRVRCFTPGAILVTSAHGAQAAAGLSPTDSANEGMALVAEHGTLFDPLVRQGFLNSVDHRDVYGRSGYTEGAFASMAAGCAGGGGDVQAHAGDAGTSIIPVTSARRRRWGWVIEPAPSRQVSTPTSSPWPTTRRGTSRRRGSWSSSYAADRSGESIGED